MRVDPDQMLFKSQRSFDVAPAVVEGEVIPSIPQEEREVKDNEILPGEESPDDVPADDLLEDLSSSETPVDLEEADQVTSEPAAETTAEDGNAADLSDQSLDPSEVTTEEGTAVDLPDHSSNPEEATAEDGTAADLPDQSSDPAETTAEDGIAADLPVLSSDSEEGAAGELPEEYLPDAAEGEMYALVQEGFQVTNELMVMQMGLLLLLFGFFLFSIFYRLISNMVTKF